MVLMGLGRTAVDQLTIRKVKTNERVAIEAALPSPRWLSPSSLAGGTLGNVVGRAMNDVTAWLQ